MSSRSFSIAPAVLLCGLLSSGLLTANERNSYFLEWDNDSFLEPFGFEYTDRHYSNGLRFGFWCRDNECAGAGLAEQSSAKQAPLLGTAQGGNFLWSASLMHSFWNAGMEIERTRGGLSFGQEMYTPEDIAFGYGGIGFSPDAFRLQVDDRPYAGYLFLAPLWERRGLAPVPWSGAVPARDRFRLELGVVGPSAQAQQLQSRWHTQLNGVEPVGWRHQLNDEPAILLHAERSWRLTQDLAWDGAIGADLIPTLGVDLGNVSTQLLCGAELRFGAGHYHDFTVPSLGETSDGLGVFLFAQAEGRVVARNIFLDGNTFSSSHSVDKRPLVGEISLGVGVKWNGCELRTAWVRRSREFDLQDVPNSYLATTLTLSF